VNGKCPLCGSSLDDLPPAGKDAAICSSCGAVTIARQDVRRLALGEGIQDELAKLAPDALASTHAIPSPTELGKMAGGPCPGCGGVLDPFRYGGGTAPALDCRGCDLTIFPRGALATALDEQRHGISLTGNQRAALRDVRLGSTLGTYLRASEIILVLGLVSIIVLLRLARVGMPAWAFVVVAAAVVGYVIHRARHAERLANEAERRADRIAAAEAAPAAVTPAPRRRAKGAPCAWCGAPLPPKATRCNECDSDFAS
jgi:hypothetical protein